MPNAAPDRMRWYALGLLAFAYTCQSIDRQVIAVVIEPIKREFKVDDLAMGFLGGLAYTATFALACIPAGWLIDRMKRRVFLAGLLSIWSALTVLCGFAGGYLSLLVLRMGVGASEAGAQPACISLISDFFGPRQRSSVIGYFYLSTAIGISLSFFVGGMIAAHFGWRAAFFIAGLPGILIAVVIATTLREPRRGNFETEPTANATLRQVIAHVRATPAIIHLTLGMTLTSLTVTAMWLWMTSLLIRVHGLGLSHADTVVALAASTSAFGSVVAGRIADKISQKSTSRLLFVPIATSLLCVPFGIGLAYAPGLPLAYLCLAGTAFALGGFLGPCYSMAMVLAPTNMRGVIAAVLQMSINLLGAGLGPMFLGALSDMFGGSHSLQPALALTMVFNLWAALHFLLCYRANISNTAPSGGVEMAWGAADHI
jgi:MFS family permease